MWRNCTLAQQCRQAFGALAATVDDDHTLDRAHGAYRFDLMIRLRTGANDRQHLRIVAGERAGCRTRRRTGAKRRQVRSVEHRCGLTGRSIEDHDERMNGR
jgi:hypothetical protein